MSLAAGGFLKTWGLSGRRSALVAASPRIFSSAFLRLNSTTTPSPAPPRQVETAVPQKLVTVEDYNNKLKQTVSFFSSREKPVVLQNVLDLCASMKKNQIQPNIKTYNYLLEGLATKLQIPFALKMLNEIIAQNLKPDLSTVNVLLKMHIPFGDFLGAMSIFELLDTYSIKPNSETFTTLIEIAANSAPHSFKVEALVKEMLNRKLYTAEAGSKAIETLVYNLAPFEAYSLLRLIEKENEKVSMAAYASLLYGLSSTDNSEAMNHCFKALRSGKSTDVMLDEGLILAVLSHARRNGDLDLAHHAVFALEEIKPVYQDFHFLPLLDLLAQKGSYYRLFEITLLMESMGIPLRLKAFNEVMFEIGRSEENMDKAYFALEDLKSQKKVNAFVFNIVLGGCASGKDIDRTFATFAEAENLGVKPNLDSFHMLLELCVKTKQGKVAERVWKELEASRLEPNAETYSRYVDTCLACGDYQTAKDIFEVASSKHMRLAEGVYVRLITQFTHFDNEFALKVAGLMKSIGGYSVGSGLTKHLTKPTDQEGVNNQ